MLSAGNCFEAYDSAAAAAAGVMVGNGNYMVAEGVVNKLTIKAQNATFQLLVFLLPILGANLILGSSWLKTIGPHIADYDKLQLKFMYDGKFTTLQGETYMITAQAQLHHIRRMLNTDVIAEIFTMQLIEPNSVQFPLVELPNDMEPELALLLHSYSVVFGTPTSLPPPRSHDHYIPLVEGSQPVKVKPYRYPHSRIRTQMKF